jgi:hypothetical protein
MTKKALSAESARLTELEACEQRVWSAYRRGLELSLEIGEELSAIKEESLYLERGYETFQEYVETELPIEYATARRLINILQTRNFLKEKIPAKLMPENESQLAELTRIPLEHRADVWRQVRDQCDPVKQPITVYVIRKAVDLAEGEIRGGSNGSNVGGLEIPIAEEPEPETAEEETESTEPGETPKESEPEPAISGKIFTERGEVALDRIRRHCGAAVADGIAAGRVKISENQLIEWADLDDTTLRNLAYYIVDLAWRFPRALAYENKATNGFTSLDELVLRARARGGKTEVQHQDFRVLVEYAPKAAAA